MKYSLSFGSFLVFFFLSLRWTEVVRFEFPMMEDDHVGDIDDDE